MAQQYPHHCPGPDGRLWLAICQAAQQLVQETELVQARDTGPALVDEAVEWGAELIVMGLPYKRRFSEFSLGKTVPYVLKNANCRVLLFREHREHQA